MKPLKFGIAGLGIMGAGHCKSMMALDEVELVAIADTNAEVLQQIAAETGARPFDGYETMIREGGIEAILIATPHYFHPPATEFAARQGVHVLCEKPIAVSVAAADRMVEACRRSEVKLGIMFQQRLDSSRRTMPRMIAEGVLGTIHRISMTAPWYRTQAYYDSGAWRGTWKGEGGGILMNQAPHSLDQFLWLGGQPQAVQSIALTRLHNIEVENTCAAVLDYGNGQVGTLYVSTAEIPGGERIEAAGDKGLLLWENGRLRHYVLDEPLSHHLHGTTDKFSQPVGEWQDIELENKPGRHAQVIRAFVRAVREDDESLLVATGEDGLHSLELANALLMAGYTRREVPLPLDRVQFEQMLGRLQDGVAPAELRGPKTS